MKARSVNHHHLQSKISDIRNHLPHMFCNNPNRVKWSSWSSIWGQHTHSQSIWESTDSSNFNAMSRLSVVNSILDINKLHCADDFTFILFFSFLRKKKHPGDRLGAANSLQFHPIFRIELIPHFLFKWIELIFSSDGDQREALLPNQIKTSVP